MLNTRNLLESNVKSKLGAPELGAREISDMHFKHVQLRPILWNQPEKNHRPVSYEYQTFRFDHVYIIIAAAITHDMLQHIS